ncbi:STAS domain-containing protein [Neisseria yangbaofengii]|uniref:STAS domain-containing protein n=1 Tax=Neisseria yangbaofengii TaxID=2709396 RepID=UPI001FD74BB1
MMLATVCIMVYSHNLALGLLAGVLLSALFFANKTGRYMSVHKPGEGRILRYDVVGQVFFASSDDFNAAFDFGRNDVKNVTIGLTYAHLWDVNAVSALDKVVLRYRKAGTEVEITGLNEAGRTLVDRFGTHNKSQAAGIIGR